MGAPLAGGQVHVGRQAVYDADLAVVGYELLFRDARHATSAARGDDSATTAVVVATFAEFGLEELVGDRSGFINLTRSFLVGDLPVPFGPRHAVLEVLETVRLDADVVAGMRRLRAEGYRLALDDVVWSSDVEAVLGLVDYVKVDLLTTPVEQAGRIAARCADAGVVALAERVEDAEVLQRCRELGFTLFQGYHLSRPQTLTTATLAPSSIAALRLMTALSRPDATVDDVEELVRLDPGLTYRLLRIVNSAAAGLPRRVASLREALVLVGLRRLSGWLALMSLAEVTSPTTLQPTVARARACELVAADVPGARPDEAFLVGLVHGLGALLGLRPDDLAAQLALDDSLAAPLRGAGTPLGAVLAAVLAHERDDDTGVLATGLDLFDVSRACLAALGWSLLACEAAAPAP